MPGKARVHELAKEFGVDSRTVLAKLKELGIFVRSASSTIEAPDARRLRECFPQRPRAASPPGRRSAVQQHSAPLPPVRRTPSMPPPRPRPVPILGNRRPRREWYRGEAPEGLTKYLLDHFVVEQRDPEERPPGRPYWDDEVRYARKLSNEWAGTLLEGLAFPDIVRYVRAGWPSEHAAALHRAGVKPGELGWSYEDRGDYPLVTRLTLGRWTVEMVVNEVERRRALG